LSDIEYAIRDDRWELFWTSRSVEVPAGRFALLDEWADIDRREQALGIDPRTPFLLDPEQRVDARLSRFFRRSRFSFLADGTQLAYVKDYRLFFSFLWAQGKYWDEADSDDIDDYEAWRRRSKDNPRTIGGCKWARELAAFKLLYEWAAAKGHITRSPVAVHQVCLRDGTTVEVADNQPRDLRYSNVKWVTPRTFRWWRDIGLRGYGAGGLPDSTWRGRNGDRNAAFADLLFESGLRLWLAEGGLPMDYESWDAVFTAASERCERLGEPIRVSPHACRHSFALKMLVALQRGMDRRFGLAADERDHLRKVYGNAFALVKDLLGHRSEQTTRDIYLEPLNGIRLAQILDGSEDLDQILAQVASSSRLVMDVGGDEA
jgi:integrase